MKTLLMAVLLTGSFILGWVAGCNKGYSDGRSTIMAVSKKDVYPMPWGRIEVSTNEISIISTVDDPPKIRLASPNKTVGAMSFNKLRADGKQQELALLSLSMEKSGPMFKLHVSDGLGDQDKNMHRVMEASVSEGVTVFVPFRASAGFKAD